MILKIMNRQVICWLNPWTIHQIVFSIENACRPRTRTKLSQINLQTLLKVIQQELQKERKAMTI